VIGLTITTAPAGTISGRVTTESGSAPPAGVQLRFEAATGAMYLESTVVGRPQPAGPGRSGSLPPYGFRMSVPASGAHLGVAVPDGWMLKAIEIGAADVTDRVIEARGGNAEVHVVLTDRVTQLDGTVSRESHPAPDVDVVVFPDDPALWAFPARHVRAVRTAADGTFRARGLPPHQSYLAVAVDYLDDGETQDPEFLDALRAHATRFSIDYGEARALALAVVGRR
jgi:hypothetical protein